MGVPKRKVSKSRRDKRRANDFLTAVNLSKCPQCNEMRLPHRVCPTCGYYHDRLVLPSEDED